MVKELQQRQKIKQMLYSYPSLFLIAVLTFFLAKGASSIMAIERESARRAAALEAQSSTLALHEEELKGEVARLRTEEGIIGEIKDKFRVTREGEYVAIIVDEKKSATSSDNSGQIWYKKLWSAIIGK
jgi:cell division protein FtsB